MRIATLALVIVLVAGLFGAASAGQTTATSSVPEVKPGVVRGRVISADTGKALRRARISLIPSNPSSDRWALAPAYTNGAGQYEFRDVPAGTYLVSASRSGYVQLQYGQRRPGEKGRSVEVHSGDAVERIDISLPLGAVLAGSVVDDAGEPYPGVSVDAVRLHYDRGRRVPDPVGGVETDDLGRFRIAGLEPGNYYLVASSSETWHGDRNETYGYASSHYPVGGPMERASQIILGASEVREGLFMTLQASRTVRVSGRVVRETGEPVSGTGVTLAYGYPGMFMRAGLRQTRTAQDGTFQFKDVAGGSYSLMEGSASQSVNVTGEDIGSLVLVVRTGSTVSGNLVTDDGAAPPFGPSGVRMLLDATSDNVLPTVQVVAVESDWSFKLANVGGPFLFRLLGIPDDWMLGSVTFGEKDITDVAWDVPTFGRQFRGLTLVVTNKVGTITGSVVDASEKPTADAAVVVFADNPELWIPGSRFVRTTRPDGEGRFSIKGLPDGTYCAIARAFIEDGQWQAADFLEQARAGASTFTIAEGASASARLTVRR